MDVNDRQLRNIVDGLGGPANGIPTETGFDITAASELMAVICLAAGEEDLRARIDRLVVGIKRDGTAYTCKELGATGALMALLLEAVKPNLVQTLEGTPAFVHGGPLPTSPTAATRSRPRKPHSRWVNLRLRKRASGQTSVPRSSTTSSAGLRA